MSKAVSGCMYTSPFELVYQVCPCALGCIPRLKRHVLTLEAVSSARDKHISMDLSLQPLCAAGEDVGIGQSVVI